MHHGTQTSALIEPDVSISWIRNSKFILLNKTNMSSPTPMMIHYTLDRM